MLPLIAQLQRTTCSLCGEVRGSHDNRFRELTLMDPVCLLSAVSDKYRFIPSLGALVPGHMLTVTVNHHLNIAASLQTEADISEFENAMLDLMQSASRFFGEDFLIFEHGSTRPAATLCSTSHAHVHIVPMDVAVRGLVLGQVSAEGAMEVPWLSLAQTACEAEDFVWVASATPRGVSPRVQFLPAADRPSQFLRRLVANALGSQNWDWRENPANEALARTRDTLIVMSAGTSIQVRSGAFAFALSDETQD
jgi:hypothetical protein